MTGLPEGFELDDGAGERAAGVAFQANEDQRRAAADDVVRRAAAASSADELPPLWQELSAWVPSILVDIDTLGFHTSFVYPPGGPGWQGDVYSRMRVHDRRLGRDEL